MNETGNSGEKLGEVLKGGVEDLKNAEVLSKLDVPSAFVRIYHRLVKEEGDEGKAIANAGLRVILTTGLRLLSNRSEQPFELPKPILDIVAPGVDEQEISTAVKLKQYRGVTVRNETEARLIIGTYRSAEIVRDNADVVLKASAPELKNIGEGVRDLAKISVKTAIDFVKAAAAFGVDLTKRVKKNK